MNNDNHEFCGCERRAYGWLADVFWDIPSRETLDDFHDIDFSGTVPKMRATAQSLATCIASVTDESYEDIEVDYTALFAACRANSPYPFESVFLGDKPGIMMQEPRDEVMRLFQEYGFETEKGWPWQPEDHLTHELRFVETMYERLGTVCDDDELSLAGEALDIMKSDHLQKWVPLFSRAVREKAETDFYRLAADLLDEMVKC